MRDKPITILAVVILVLGTVALVTGLAKGSQQVEERLVQNTGSVVRSQVSAAVGEQVQSEVRDQLDERLVVPSSIPTHDLPPEFRPVDPATTTTLAGPYDPSTTTTTDPPPTTTTTTLPEVPTTVTVPDTIPGELLP